jgi:hypothetical protein
MGLHFTDEEGKGAEDSLVRLSQTGWQGGKQWDAAYEYLAAGNAEMLGMLDLRYVAGRPIGRKMTPQAAKSPGKWGKGERHEGSLELLGSAGGSRVGIRDRWTLVQGLRRTLEEG